MHMVLTIVGGMLALSLFLLFGHLWGGQDAGLLNAAKMFIPVWLAVSLFNMWIGVNKAGYEVREELPILLIVFAVPALAAGFCIWRLSR